MNEDFFLFNLIFFCKFVKMSDMQKEKLRTVRKMKGFTQQQMAEVIPTDVSNYSRKESGTVSITQTEWSKLAKFLEVPVEEIYEEEEVKFVVENPIFNDSSLANIGNNNTTNISNELSIEIIKTMQEYIGLLKEEIERLKK
ncbi:DNA-binding helix-turn-helix protein [Chryseobacterium gleum ATCC 35910]|nr:DNA-binding helix-turn-helix protein [Chryseobacterium gleum ATCC 35910]